MSEMIVEESSIDSKALVMDWDCLSLSSFSSRFDLNMRTCSESESIESSFEEFLFSFIRISEIFLVIWLRRF